MAKYNPTQTHKGHPKHNVAGPFGIHAGKQICLKCNCFVKWLSKDFFIVTGRTNINNNNNIITTNNNVIRSVLSSETADTRNDMSLRDSLGYASSLSRTVTAKGESLDSKRIRVNAAEEML